MTATQLAAWYGAVVATLSFCVALSSFLRDRVNLFAKLTPNMKLSQSHGDYSTEYTYTFILIGNRGRRTVTVGKVWFSQAGSDKSLLVIDAFRAGRVELAEGASRDYLMRDDNLDINTLTRIHVEDATGRKWSGKVQFKEPIKLKPQWGS